MHVLGEVIVAGVEMKKIKAVDEAIESWCWREEREVPRE